MGFFSLFLHDKYKIYMKLIALFFALISSTVAYSATPAQSAQFYLERAEQHKLDQDVTWQRLMYADEKITVK